MTKQKSNISKDTLNSSSHYLENLTKKLSSSKKVKPLKNVQNAEVSQKFNIFEPWKSLDPWQKKYIETEGNCFLLCGRQSGKSAAASIKFGKRAAENPKRIIYMLAYTEKQAYNLFFKTLMYLRSEHPRMIITKGADKPTKHIIKLRNGSQIFCYAAGLTGEGIRGPTVTDLVVDEAAPMANEVFTAISPMLSITKGNFDIISTPRGKTDKDGEETYFYKCSKRDDFTKFYISAEDCPRHSKEFLAAEKASMGELEYAQEYLAKFLDDLKRVFSDKQIQELCVLNRRPIIPSRDYFLGCDVGRKKDPFTYEIFDGTNSERIAQAENLTTIDIPLPESARRIIELNKRWNFNKELIDSGGMGISVCDILREDEENKGKVIEINNASRKYTDEEGNEKKKGIFKEDLYKHLISLMDRKRIRFLNDDDLKLSFASVQVEMVGGQERYFGNNTHIVEGITRAVWGIKTKSLRPYIY